MQKDTGSGDVSPSHVGRVRHRRRPNEVSCVLMIFFFSNFVPCVSGLFHVLPVWKALYFKVCCCIHTMFRSVFSTKLLIFFLQILFTNVMAMLQTS